MVLPDGVRLLAAPVLSLEPSTILDASQCLGLGLGVSFRLRPFGFLRFSSPFSLIVMSVSARCRALLAAPGKWSLTFTTLKWLSGFMLHITALILLPGVAPCWLHPKLVVFGLLQHLCLSWERLSLHRLMNMPLAWFYF